MSKPTLWPWPLWRHFHWSALVMALLCCLLLLAINYLIAIEQVFSGWTIYGFWLVATVIAAIYGTLEGFAAALLCSLIYITGQWFFEEAPPPFLYILLLPAQWTLAALLFGEIRLYYKEQEYLNQVVHYREKYDNLHGLYHQSNDRVHYLEREIKTYHVDIAEIIQALGELVNIKPVQVLLHSEKAILACLAPNKFSLYAVSANGLEIVLSHGWLDSDHYPRRIETDDLLYQRVVVKGETLSWDRTEMRPALERHGIIAAPLCDTSSGEVFGIIKIEEKEKYLYEEGVRNIVTTLASFLGIAYSMAKHSQQAARQAIFSNEGLYFSYKLYEVVWPLLEVLARNKGMPLTCITLSFNLEEGSTEMALTRLYHSLKELMPPQCWIFLEVSRRQEVLLLLPSVEGEGAVTIEQQLKALLTERYPALAGRCVITRRIHHQSGSSTLSAAGGELISG